MRHDNIIVTEILLKSSTGINEEGKKGETNRCVFADIWTTLETISHSFSVKRHEHVAEHVLSPFACVKDM